MSDGHRLVQMMREAGKTPQNEIVDIVMGKVTSVNPCKVKVENRELTESFLILGDMCKEKHSVGSIQVEGKTVNFDVLLWRGLRVGDQVMMLKVGRGQKYYILQRKE